MPRLKTGAAGVTGAFSPVIGVLTCRVWERASAAFVRGCRVSPVSKRFGPRRPCLVVNPGGGTAAPAFGCNRPAKTISPALRAFLAGQILFASRFSTALRPQAVQPARLPPVGSQQGRDGREPCSIVRRFIMATIGTFTADKDGFTGTLRTLTLNVKAKLVPNDKGTTNTPRLPRAGGGLRHRRGVEESQQGRTALRVRDPRRSFVPSNGLCPADRGRGRHAHADLVAQQAPGGLMAASAPPTRRGAVPLSQSCMEAWSLQERGPCWAASVEAWGESAAARTAGRVGALHRRAYWLRPVPSLSSRPFGANPHAFAALRASLAPGDRRKAHPRRAALGALNTAEPACAGSAGPTAGRRCELAFSLAH